MPSNNAGAYTSLLRLKQVSDLVIVTSRQFVIQKPTLKWLDLHYPGIFAEVHFGNHWALEGKSKPKSEICRQACFPTVPHSVSCLSCEAELQDQ